MTLKTKLLLRFGWYRIWSDTFHEEGGLTPSGADLSTMTKTLLKPFKNTNGAVLGIQRDGPSGNFTNGLRILNYTATSFQINYRTGGTQSAYYTASGY